MKHPTHAKVVVIGAGVIGCSVAYQLAKNGIKDVVVLERKSIASGTSWHAAGILSEMRSSESMITMAKETTNMFRELEKETGHNIHFKRTGTLLVTANRDRHDQFKTALSTAKAFDVEAYEIPVDEAGKKWPLVNTEDLVGALWVPNDALICPEQGTLALAKGARMHGAQIFENITVKKLIHSNGRVTGVETADSTIFAEYVIVTSGMWTRDFLSKYGVNAPLHAMEHYYILTEPIPDVDPNLPLLRDFDARSYVRPTLGTRWHTTGGHLMLGFFEHGGKPWGMDGIPDDFEFGRIEPDRDHLENVYNLIKHRIPAVRNVGIDSIMCGPESFTYDNNYFMGESQTLKNLLLATGFNSRGIQSSGGAGRFIAEWILEGKRPNRYDNSDLDACRFPAYTANRKFLYERSREVLGLLYDISYPHLQLESARPIRMSPVHDRLASLGACFGERSGWERVNWYAPPGVDPAYRYTFGKPDWLTYVTEEHRAVRENVAVFDQTSFGKLLVQGSQALDLLEGICGNKIDVATGRVVYTQILNDRGGIESDITITRTEPETFLIYTSAGSQARDYYLIQKRINETGLQAIVNDVTSGYAVFGIMGPQSRELMQKMSRDDFSNKAFPFFSSRMIDFGYARARATRVTFVGELGWEVSIPSEFALAAFDTLLHEGRALNMRLAGYHAMDALRLEKGYVHWGHDVSPNETPIEANLSFSLKFGKPHDFLGKAMLLKQKTEGITKRLVTFQIEAPESFPVHYEPILRNGEKVGYLTSAMYSPLFGKPLAMGYVKRPDDAADDSYILEADYQVCIMNRNYAAVPSLTPLYDPDMSRIKA